MDCPNNEKLHLAKSLAKAISWKPTNISVYRQGSGCFPQTDSEALSLKSTLTYLRAQRSQAGAHVEPSSPLTDVHGAHDHGRYSTTNCSLQQ